MKTGPSVFIKQSNKISHNSDVSMILFYFSGKKGSKKTIFVAHTYLKIKEYIGIKY